MSYYQDFVIPPTLATPEDLAEWTQKSVPDNAVILLREASALVQDATVQAYYNVDPLTGLATDAQVLLALNQATCIQAAAWAAIGYDPLTGGVQTSGIASQKKIDTASVTYADAGLASQAFADAITGLVPAAIRKLEQNNLLIPDPWTYG